MDDAFVQYAVAWLALGGGVWALFERAEAVVTDETRATLARWLNNLDSKGKGRGRHRNRAAVDGGWGRTFATVFDSLFGRRHLSWSCFFRSSVASATSVVLMTVVFWSINPELLVRYFYTPGIPTWFSAITVVSYYGVLNLIPDYISLLETRWMIGVMSRRPSFLKTITILAVDFALTAAIGLAAFLVLDRIHYLFILDLPMATLPQALSVFLPTLRFWTDDGVYQVVYFYSTFLTSAWIWLFAAGGAIIKGVQKVVSLRILDINEKPLRSIGFVCNLVITLIVLSLFIVKH